MDAHKRVNQNVLSLEQETMIKHKTIWNTRDSLCSESMRIWVSIPLYLVDIVLLCPKYASLCYGGHKHFRNTQGDGPKSSFLGWIPDLKNLDMHRGDPNLTRFPGDPNGQSGMDVLATWGTFQRSCSQEEVWQGRQWAWRAGENKGPHCTLCTSLSFLLACLSFTNWKTYNDI